MGDSAIWGFSFQGTTPAGSLSRADWKVPDDSEVTEKRFHRLKPVPPEVGGKGFHRLKPVPPLNHQFSVGAFSTWSTMLVSMGAFRGSSLSPICWTVEKIEDPDG